jgi:hypothetical protein
MAAAGDPSPQAIEHAFSELRKLYHEGPNRPRRHPAKDGSPPNDYKFCCFSGRVQLIHVDVARFTGHRRGLYTPDWVELPVTYMYPMGRLDRPARLADMVSIAETLAEGTSFVRVDFYSDGRDVIKFSEMTLTPENACGRFSDPEFDVALGKFFRPEHAGGDHLARWRGVVSAAVDPQESPPATAGISAE